MWCIVPAAGIGSRFGATIPKQYSEISPNITILEYTLRKLLEYSRFKGVMIALHPEDKYWNSLAISQEKKIFTCFGGSERNDSVTSALMNIKTRFNIAKNEWIMVHDAARPGIKIELLEKLYLEVTSSQSCGGILATRIADTIKLCNDSNHVAKTVDRNNLWAAQTPQLFKFNNLITALENQSICHHFTDESSAIEALGLLPKIIESDPFNFKITTQMDLVIMREILKVNI